MAPGVKIMPLKFIGPKGGYTSDAILALGYAKKMETKIASNSWVSSSFSSALRDAINVFGEVFVKAVENDGRNTDVSPIYPASYDCLNIISVTAVNNRGGLASFSKVLNTNPFLTPGQAASLLMQSAVPLLSLQDKTASGGMVNTQEALLDATGSGPFVTGTDPVNGAIEVPLDKTIAVDFSENIVEGANFSGISLTAGIAPVEAVCTINRFQRFFPVPVQHKKRDNFSQ